MNKHLWLVIALTISNFAGMVLLGGEDERCQRGISTLYSNFVEGPTLGDEKSRSKNVLPLGIALSKCKSSLEQKPVCCGCYAINRGAPTSQPRLEEANRDLVGNTKNIATN